jgi:hypothetical protein
MGCGVVSRRRLQIRSRYRDNGGIEEERSDAREENWVEDGLDLDVLISLTIMTIRSLIF